MELPHNLWMAPTQLMGGPRRTYWWTLWSKFQGKMTSFMWVFLYFAFFPLCYSNFDNFRVRGHTRHLSMVDDSQPSYGTFVNGVKTAQYSCQRIVEGHGHTRKLSMICYSRVMKLSTLFSKLFYGWQPYKSVVNDSMLSQPYLQFVNVLI